ncbi:hypothetical protein pneo_cds_375 [Pandoravirus neocaledonia]|uniref:Rho binding incomplete domain containing protein n=1 Tax=Pandoravirus neocaledonia TaxID=2107708 RepID=A0A2U7UC63_9VIRU|nr:hypothetical protein pneo_cds_375 [Pandoravirus neocaledonia]AVK75982.1 hypothetical protein pneo_cds_375 [Pandoravirus neocaledonia]
MMSTPTATRTRPFVGDARGPSLGDGDADEDWAPPTAPRKPILSISLDTRRGAGHRRHCHVSVSASAPLLTPPSSTTTTAVNRYAAARTPHRPSTRNGAGSRRQQGMWVKKERSCDDDVRSEPPQETAPDDSVAALAAAIVDTLVRRPSDRDARRHVARADKAHAHTVAVTVCDADVATATPEPALVNDAQDSGASDGDNDRTKGTALHPTDHNDGEREDKFGAADQHAEPRRIDGAGVSTKTTSNRVVHRYSRAPSSTNVLARPEERRRFASALIAALVERPYGLTFAEVARLATRLSGVRCTGQDARLLIRDIPRDTVVVRRMMTPWFVPRVAVALDTRIALERVVAPAVAHVLYTCGNGIDLQRLDVTVFARTGTSLRVHAVNYASGGMRNVLSFVPQVVGRIEKIAQRVVVYPTGHTRAMALFAPLDDRDDGDDPDAAAESRPAASDDDTRVSRAARCEVTLARTIETAANACAEVIAAALESHTDAAVAIDCRGPIGGRQARGPPVGMLQMAALAPAAIDLERREHAPPPPLQKVYQFDMVALHAEWMEWRESGGPVDGPPTFFHAIGIADLLADSRLVKVVFDSRPMSQTFWRCASCPMTRVFDMRLATLALGVGVAVPWSDNDTLASMGTVIDADMHELDAMVGTDAWAWHRRPLPLRARGAAARQVVALGRAYQKAVAMHEETRSDAAPSSVDGEPRAPVTVS